MTLTVECTKDFQGRWLAEVPQLPGVQAYGATRDAATELALSMVYGVLEKERVLGVRSATADVYGRQSERRLTVVAASAAF